MTALSTKFSKNMGRLFENVVFQRLIREHETVHYYRDDRGHEVDFALLEDGKTTALYQVCYDVSDEETQVREVRSLMKAGDKLKCKNLNLVTLERVDTVKLPEEIKVISAIEYFSD